MATFPSADLTVAGIGAVVLRKKAIYCKKKSVTPFPWLVRGPAAAHPVRTYKFNISLPRTPRKSLGLACSRTPEANTTYLNLL